jgi:protein TonB
MLTHPAVTRAAPLVVSFALHAIVVGGALAFGQFLSPRPVVLEAVLVPADPPPAVEPPRPEPPRPKPPKAVVPPKPITPPPPPREIVTEPPPAPVAPTPPPARPPETAPPPAMAAAPAPAPAEPRVSDAPGPRRPSTPVSSGVEAVPGPAPAAPAAAPPMTARTVPDAPSQLARPSGGRQVIPSYPSSARRLGIQGTTMLRVHVAADGQVTEVQVDETAGHPDLDRAAADAVRRWRFEPGRRGSEAVAMWVRVPVQFVLK